MAKKIVKKEVSNEGLAAYVGITAPETPKYLLANNFLLEYFESSGNTEQEYNYRTFEESKTLYTEDDKNKAQLQQSFDCFLKKYLGEDNIREENRRLNENRHYYFPITQSMLVSSTPNLWHMLFYLQNIGKNFDFEKMQDLLADYIFDDDTGINHIVKILLQNQEQEVGRKKGVDEKTYEGFWSMLTTSERTRMERNYKKITMLRNRKLNYLCLCDEMKIEKGTEQVTVTVKFHLLKQIEILLEDYTAVLKSARDLAKVQSMLENQSLSPALRIDFFVSNNPIELIRRMLDESQKTREEIAQWIEETMPEEKRQNFREFWEDFERKEQNNPFGGVLEKNELRYGKKVKEYVLKYYGQIYSLYEFLAG